MGFVVGKFPMYQMPLPKCITLHLPSFPHSREPIENYTPASDLFRSHLTELINLNSDFAALLSLNSDLITHKVLSSGENSSIFPFCPVLPLPHKGRLAELLMSLT